VGGFQRPAPVQHFGNLETAFSPVFFVLFVPFVVNAPAQARRQRRPSCDPVQAKCRYHNRARQAPRPIRLKEKTMPSQVSEGWKRSGIQEGDTVLIHSSLTKTLRDLRNRGIETSAELILDSFLDAVGSSGTLLLPLFNFSFTKGVSFDIRGTPSQMGALTEAARRRPGAVRTGHPIYSFAAIGAKAGRFNGVDNFSGYGSDSPFAILRELDGKIAILDLPDQRSMTFYHHVEEMHNVPYRYHKTFTGDYTDAEGAKEHRTYGLFVRDIERGVCTHVDPAGELSWENGLYTGYRPGEGTRLRVISARRMFDFVSNLIVSGRAEGLLYKVDKEAAHA
jgi:aminoglycoside 3-N-acetyltransferase